jgi:heme oxygenase
VSDQQALKERLRVELDKLDLTESEKDQLVNELNMLACILIEVTREKPTDHRA